MKVTTHVIPFLIATLIAFSSTLSADVEIDTNDNSVILAGHDTVAYFTQNKSVLGSAEFTAIHHNAIYRFSSVENRDIFKSDPHKYEPQYGGFCAYGVSVGKKFSVDGKAFKVVDGKLYVNKNLKVYNLWIKDIPGNIQKENKQWENIKDTPADKL